MVIEPVVDKPLIPIGQAAKMVRVHPKTLRVWDREGVFCPYRTSKKIRLYSHRDLRVLQYIRDLTHDKKMNLDEVKILLAEKGLVGQPVLDPRD